MQTLISYVVFSSSDPEGTVYPVAKSVLSLLGVPSPITPVFTGVFGVKGNSALYPHLYRKLKPGQLLSPVNVVFDAQVSAIDYVGLSDGVLLKDTKAVNLSRLRSDFATEIKELWEAALGDEYVGNEAKFPAKPTAHPQFIELIRAKHPHLEQIIYPVSTPVGRFSVASSWVKPVSVTAHHDLPGPVVFD